MTKKKENPEEESKAFLKEILPQFINQLIKDKKFTKDQLSDKKLVLEKVLEYLDNDKIEIQYAVDHRNEIINKAVDYYEKDYYLSITLISFFIEHTINSIIDLYCRENSVSEKYRIEIIRNLSIASKFSWLLVLMKLPKINSRILKSIIKIAESRNSFVHYKWKYSNIDEDKIENKITLTEIKTTIKYLKTYESKIEFNGLKNQIKKI